MRSMSSSELHLFVFEGVRAESKYVDKLEQHFLGKRISVKCVYDAEIYQLYKQLKAEEFAFDMVNLLKERSPPLTTATIMPRLSSGTWSGARGSAG